MSRDDEFYLDSPVNWPGWSSASHAKTRRELSEFRERNPPKDPEMNHMHSPDTLKVLVGCTISHVWEPQLGDPDMHLVTDQGTLFCVGGHPCMLERSLFPYVQQPAVGDEYLVADDVTDALVNDVQWCRASGKGGPCISITLDTSKGLFRFMVPADQDVVRISVHSPRPLR